MTKLRTSHLETLQEVEFDDALAERVLWSSLWVLIGLLIFTLAYRENREFYSVLGGGLLSLVNYRGLAYLVRRLTSPSTQSAWSRLATTGLMFGKILLLGGGVLLALLVLNADPFWLVTGLSIVIFGIFRELLNLLRQARKSQAAAATNGTTEDHVQHT